MTAIQVGRLYSFMKKKTLIIATGNPGKQREFAALLGENPEFTLTFVSSSDPPETGATFLENARIKATANWELNRAQDEARAERIYLGEDSGIKVDALGGYPGVLSARMWALEFRDRKFVAVDQDATTPPNVDAYNNGKLLSLLEGVSNRRARYVSAIVCLDETGREVFSGTGTAEGRVSDSVRGTNGFGYDVLFIGDETGGKLTWGEVPPEEKCRVSHRTKAIQMLIGAL